ncbi:hypothetical protein [Cupriavidus pauculus]|jgi:hypothetical protein|uniref:hypothetical protein n=1 Tax=Cupriavidus pauculus TaxID=82633 RepID=UPI001CC05A2A|nr:hypothetical protein [Cupriavidus pauculus]
MREYHPRTIQELAACTCDRCKRRLTPDNGEWQERLSFDHACGFDSLFGDGNTVSLDLCQRCVREVLGQWLRIIPAEGVDALDRLRGSVVRYDEPTSAAAVEWQTEGEKKTRKLGGLEKFTKFGPDFMAEGRGEHEQVERGKAARRFRALKGRGWAKHGLDAPLFIGGTKKPKKRL